MFHRFTGIANLLLAGAFVGVGWFAAGLIRNKRARQAVRVAVVMLALVWLSIQWHGGCA